MMQRKTARKVVNLLLATEITLESTGRPRKQPGRPRAEAVKLSGKPVRPTDPYATAFSLPGALKANAKMLGYGANVRMYAAWALLDESKWYFGEDACSLSRLDDNTFDTRTLVRYCRAARKYLAEQIEKGHSEINAS